jgi:hypothetical protein
MVIVTDGGVVVLGLFSYVHKNRSADDEASAVTDISTLPDILILDCTTVSSTGNIRFFLNGGYTFLDH